MTAAGFRAWRDRIPAATALLIVLSLAGCAAAPQAGEADSLDFELELFLDRGGGAMELYRVERGRSISFGGGLDARDGRVSWTGDLAAADVDAIRAVLEEHGYYATRPATTGEAHERRATLTIRSARGDHRHRVRGTAPAVESLRDVLEPIARRRHERALHALPRPGERR
jgi:hypothetical protein